MNNPNVHPITNEILNKQREIITKQRFTEEESRRINRELVWHAIFTTMATDPQLDMVEFVAYCQTAIREGCSLGNAMAKK